MVIGSHVSPTQKLRGRQFDPLALDSIRLVCWRFLRAVHQLRLDGMSVKLSSVSLERRSQSLLLYTTYWNQQRERERALHNRRYIRYIPTAEQCR